MWLNLEFIDNGIKSLKAQAIRENRNPDQIKTVILTFPQALEGTNNSIGAGQQPLGGSWYLHVLLLLHFSQTAKIRHYILDFVS
jgi:hypothetical protein